MLRERRNASGDMVEIIPMNATELRIESDNQPSNQPDEPKSFILDVSFV